MRAVVAAMIVAACGAPSQNQVPSPSPSPSPSPISGQRTGSGSGSGDLATLACLRLGQLQRAHCGNFDRIQIDPDTCARVLVGATSHHFTECLASHEACGEVTACVREQPADAPKLADCAHHLPDEMVGVSPDDFAHRVGATATHFSDVATTTVAHPLETCGFTSELRTLLALACDDDSHPIASGLAAEKARVGAAGTGGRCNSVIDHYQVACPDKTYDLFVDAYVCPRG